MTRDHRASTGPREPVGLPISTPSPAAPQARAGAARSGRTGADRSRPTPSTIARCGSAATRVLLAACAAAGTLALTGCANLFSEGAATTAGVGGTAVAGAVTRNATVASGIGLGVLAASQAGVKAVERDFHADQQDDIAAVAGALKVGQVGHWSNRHRIELEPDQSGRVTVSRVLGASELSCKEIVFSVDRVRDKETPSAFYVAMICKDAAKWRWASAEPATARWGSLQ